MLAHRWALAFGAVLALALTAAGAAPPVHVTFATPSLTALNWTNFVAQALGFYDREGLQLDLSVVEPKTILSAIISGSIEIGLGNGADAIVADDKGADLVAVGSGADSNPYKFMAAASVKSFRDLKGKTIGISGPLDTYTYVIKDVLRRNGLDPERDVDFITGGGQNQRMAALLGGGIAAGLVSPPYDTQLAERGFTSLAYIPDYFPHMQASITIVRRDWARRNGDVLRRYLRAQAAASHWLNDPANRPRAIAILVAALKTTPAEASESYDAYVKRRFFTDGFCELRPGMEAVLKMMHDQGRTPSTTAEVGKYVDPEWCPRGR